MAELCAELRQNFTALLLLQVLSASTPQTKEERLKSRWFPIVQIKLNSIGTSVQLKLKDTTAADV